MALSWWPLSRHWTLQWSLEDFSRAINAGVTEEESEHVQEASQAADLALTFTSVTTALGVKRLVYRHRAHYHSLCSRIRTS
ncbi:hypothetical protein AAFF_G00378940 [Aldrovandia affinis]|uniref:Uncharacterized protein n=1 Tax=Aldrovandia affinis TaxID=143900 RepID=A0AAD7WLS3_9TELE|nr:hypothetical protein AAFF_G00378940 [Aldrovandia affinis]